MTHPSAKSFHPPRHRIHHSGAQLDMAGIVPLIQRSGAEGFDIGEGHGQSC